MRQFAFQVVGEVGAIAGVMQEAIDRKSRIWHFKMYRQGLPGCLSSADRDGTHPPATIRSDTCGKRLVLVGLSRGPEPPDSR